MISKPSRRDFLKLTSLLAGTVAWSQLAPRAFISGSAQNSTRPNIIILVFDAMSARNLSLYGYARQTTPNFARFAERATVYHSHHSAGNFTSPGTASLLTGTYPWTHRAINLAGMIRRDLADHNIFRSIGPEYNRLAYSQNLWPNYFFDQFHRDIDMVMAPESFSTVADIVGSHLTADQGAAYRAYDDFLFQDGQPPASLVLGLLSRLSQRRAVARAETAEYPRGLPRAGNYPIFFKLREVFQGLESTLEHLASPFLAYFHMWAPHAPYRPSLEFEEFFIKDKWRPEPKPDHRLGDHIKRVTLNNKRTNYDEYVANVDAEFGKLLDALRANGLLDQSYLIVTSDHGESFERGVEGHVTKLLYEPVTHIPLLISAPGQQTRQDIYSSTNHVDLLPTIVHLTGQASPDWTDGVVLPGFGGSDNLERSTFTIEAKANRAYLPLTAATVAMVKGRYKLIYYSGYESRDSFELYDLQDDHEELNDLYLKRPELAKPLAEELLANFKSANAGYPGA